MLSQLKVKKFLKHDIKKNLKIVDLTGAGDLFAAGFLHGYINKSSIKDSLEKGTEMSSKVIQKIGPDFNSKFQKYIFRSFQTLGWKTENKKMVISAMWAIINKKNDFNVLHSHPNASLSAAYYVGAPENCGKFIIEHLNMAKRNFYPEVLQDNQLNAQAAGLEVNEGDLLIFPGYLLHKVGMNESDQDRVVISFNVEIK